MARSSLLYILGRSDVLRADGSLPASESDEDVNSIFSILASQPVAEQSRGPLILNTDDEQTFATTILGMTVEVHLRGTIQSIAVAETVLGSLEAFFATSIEQPIMPHTERFRITLTEENISEPLFEVDEMQMTARLVWPIGLSPASFTSQADVQIFLALVSGQLLVTTCIFQDPKKLLDKLFKDEAVQQRMALIAATTNSYHRVNSRHITRLTDWQDCVRDVFELRPPRPELRRINLRPGDREGATGDEKGDDEQDPRNHTQLSIRSVIDVHAWDKAQWKGIGYAEMGEGGLPVMSFLYENEESATKIFERWRERFGERDANEEIHLSIVRQLPGKNPNHYLVVVASRPPDLNKFQSGQGVAVATRSMTMEPNDSANLDRFLTAYHRSGTYLVMPAVLRNGNSEHLSKLAIIKQRFDIKLAAYVGDNDIEVVALRSRFET